MTRAHIAPPRMVKSDSWNQGRSCLSVSSASTSEIHLLTDNRNVISKRFMKSN